MFHRDLLAIVRLSRSDSGGPRYLRGIEDGGMILSGEVSSPGSGETARIGGGYLDLLRGAIGADNLANLANFLPGAGPAYEPLWRVHSLGLLTGETFPVERELRMVSDLARLRRGGLYLDIGCSAGLYTRNLARMLGDRGRVVGIDISPSMLKEAARLASKTGARPSFARADACDLPFADACFSGAVCGGTLNELGDPAHALRETRRVLEPGGRLAIMGILRATTPHGRTLQRVLSTGGVRFFETDQLYSLLEGAGFDPDPLRTHGPIFFAGASRRA